MQLPPGHVQDVDLPEIPETFVDSLGMSMFDGNSARVTFCVHRVYKIEPPKAPYAKKYPVCRLVLTPQAIVELFNGLNGMMAALQKMGLVKVEPGKPLEAVAPKTIQ